MHRICTILLTILLLEIFQHAAASAPIDYMGIYRANEDLSTEQLALVGRGMLGRNHTDSATAIYTIIINRDGNGMDSLERKYVSEALNTLGIISFMQGNYPDAYSKFKSSTQYVDSLQSPALLNLAGIYWFYGDHDKAYDILRDELTRSLRAGHVEHAGVAVLNLANLFPARNLPGKRGEIADMLRQYIRLASGKRFKPSQGGRIQYHRAIGEGLLHSLEGRHRESVTAYKKAVSNVGDMLIPDRERFSVLLLTGNEFKSMNLPDSAIACFHDAEQIARRGNFREQKMDVYKEFFALYSSMGNNGLAKEYRYKYLELNDSIYNVTDLSKINNIESSYEVQKFESQLNDIKAKHALRTRTLGIVSVGGVLLLILFMYLMFQNRLLKRKNRDLFSKNLEVMGQGKHMELSVPMRPACIGEEAQSEATGETAENGAETAARKYAGSALSEAQKEKIMSDIQRVMAQPEHFCRSGFSLAELSDLCGSNTRYISQVLNEKMDKTFSQYLNEVRIDEVRRRIVDFEHYGHLTIEALASDIGFKSRSTFSKTFKRMTGLTPSEFQNIARERHAAAK